MLIYFAGCALSMLIAGIGTKTEKYQRGNRFWTVLLSGMPLFLISAFRYYVGTDYQGYINIFNDAAHGRKRESIEYGFHLLCRVIAKLGGDYQWMVAVTSAIFVYFILWQVFKDSPYPALSIFLLVGTTYYFAAFNGIRQMCGVAVLLYSARFIEKRDIWRFAICVLIATGFHQTCAAFVLLYILKDVRIHPSMLFWITVAIFLSGSFLARAINFIMSLTKYQGYAEEGGDGVNRWIALLIQVALVLLASWRYQDTMRYRTYYNSQIITLWMSAVDDKVTWIRRMQWTFGLATIVLVPLAIKSIKGKRSRMIAIIAIVICYTLYAYIVVGRNGKHSAVPYQMFFSNRGIV